VAHPQPRLTYSTYPTSRLACSLSKVEAQRRVCSLKAKQWPTPNLGSFTHPPHRPPSRVQLEDSLESGAISVVAATERLLALVTAADETADVAQAAATVQAVAEVEAAAVAEAAEATRLAEASAADARAVDAARATAAAVPPVAVVVPAMERVQILVPEGVFAGSSVRVQAAWGGEFDIVVPAGVGPGGALAFDLPAAPPSA